MSEPTSKGTDQQQQEYYSKEWNHLALSDQPGRSGWRTTVPAPNFIEFVDWLNEQQITGRALDLGCGAGRHAILLAQNGFDVYGIDFAAAAIKLAMQNATTAGVGNSTHFQTGNSLSLPYNDKDFDVINDDGCLHHINPQQWHAYLDGVKRVIKQGGVLRVKAFSNNCDYFTQNTSDGSQWVELKDSGYTYFFSDQDIRQLFAQNFEIIKIEEKAHTQASDKKFFFAEFRLL